MHKFNEEDTFQRRVCYRFGLQFNSRIGFYHLWDSGITQSVATVRLTDDKAIVRYKPDWMFLEQLLKFRLDEGETIFVPSSNVTNHDSFIHDRVHRRCVRAVQMYNGRGEQRTVFILRNPYNMGTIQTTVSYDSPEQRRENEEVTRAMLQFLVEARIYSTFPSEMGFGQVEQVYRDLNNRPVRAETAGEAIQRRLLERIQSDQLGSMTAQTAQTAWTAGNVTTTYSQDYNDYVNNHTQETIQNIFDSYRGEE